MVNKSRASEVWGEVVAVPPAMTRKGKIELHLIGVMHHERHLRQAKIVEALGEVIEVVETGWIEVLLNFCD